MSGRFQSGHDQAEPGHWDREEREETRRPKVQKEKGWVTKMSGLYWEEPLVEGQPSPWAREFRAEGGECQPYSVTGRQGLRVLGEPVDQVQL